MRKDTINYCPYCGKKVEVGAKFCGYCGHVLVRDEKDSSMDFVKSRKLKHVIPYVLFFVELFLLVFIIIDNMHYTRHNFAWLLGGALGKSVVLLPGAIAWMFSLKNWQIFDSLHPVLWCLGLVTVNALWPYPIHAYRDGKTLIEIMIGFVILGFVSLVLSIFYKKSKCK